MINSNRIIAYPNSEDKMKSLKAFLNSLKIKFEDSKEHLYNDDFIEVIQKGDNDIKEGKGKKITIGELDDLWK